MGRRRRGARSSSPSPADDSDFETVVIDGIEVGCTSSTARHAEKIRRPTISRNSKRAAAKAAKLATAVVAKKKKKKGYAMVARGELRAAGGVIATGDERTCVPDACAVIRCLLVGGPLLASMTAATIQWFRERIATDPTRSDDEDPSSADAEAYAEAHGFVLNYQPNVSPRLLLGARAGTFFIGLKIDYIDEDGEAAQDAHALVYDAARGHLLDNLRGMGAILIDDGDRADNRTAMRPFYEKLFAKATKITLDSVHLAQLAA